MFSISETKSVIVVLCLALCLFAGMSYAQDDERQSLAPALYDTYFIHLSCGENLLNDGLRNAVDTMTTPNGHTFRIYDDASGNADHREWPDRFKWNDDWRGYDIVLFKSCYPASHIDSNQMLKEYKKVYKNKKNMWKYFSENPKILFIIVTAPPLVPNETDQEAADRARSFNNWLKKNFLNKYNKKNPGLNNVAVFDFFDVLADGNNMLRSAYRGDEWDSHPNSAGNQAAVQVFIPFFKAAVDKWAGN